MWIMQSKFLAITSAVFMLPLVALGMYKCPKLCICEPEHHAICDGKTYKSIPRGLPPDLILLNVKRNHIRRIKYKHLSYCPSLKHLLLLGNQISNIEPGAFREQRHLISLSLTSNKLQAFAPDTFKGLVNLQVFSLRDNQIRTVDESFKGLRSLQLLNLGNNRINKIGDKTFKSNNYLIVLDLHKNRIRQIHKDAFKGLPFLKYLVLRENPLKKVALDFRLNFHLELMDLTKCKLRQIVKGLPYSVNDLRLGENHITKVRKKDFKTTRKIRLLVLNGNRISAVEKRAFSHLLQLYNVHLSKNYLQRLPEKLPTSLRGLYVNQNNITTVKNRDFRSNSKLEYLFLRANHIQTIDPDSFKSLKHLKSLDISNNKIDALKPRTFKGLDKLEVLDLSNNPLSMLESRCFNGLEDLHILQMSSVDSRKTRVSQYAFNDLHSLLFLDLSNSSYVVKPLTENPNALHNLNRLEDLNFMDNNLYQLPPEFPDYFPHLKMIKLSGNPWHCDRSIYWLTKWMHNRSVEFFAKDWIRCASPEHMFGIPIYSLQFDELETTTPITTTTEQPAIIKSIDISLVHENPSHNQYEQYERVGLFSSSKNNLHRSRQALAHTHTNTIFNFHANVKVRSSKTHREKREKPNKAGQIVPDRDTHGRGLYHLERDHMKFAAKFAMKNNHTHIGKAPLYDDSSGFYDSEEEYLIF